MDMSLLLLSLYTTLLRRALVSSLTIPKVVLDIRLVLALVLGFCNNRSALLVTCGVTAVSTGLVIFHNLVLGALALPSMKLDITAFLQTF